ncbi:MAG: hypothetical protein ACFB0G_17735 [Leptolyngbyaceae cyanobacterium]
MSRRSRKHKKRFACGHRGFGQTCHCCAARQPQLAKQSQRLAENRAQQMAKSRQRQQWQATFAADPIDLKKLPRRIVLKARGVMAALETGINYWELSGKRLESMRSIIRIPVTYRYRLLCRDDGRSLIPLKVISHERYNAISRHPHRHLGDRSSVVS